jgi:hypothetical protein
MASVSALIVAGAVLFLLGIMAGVSDLIRLSMFGMGVLSFVVAGVLEIAGRRTA